MKKYISLFLFAGLCLAQGTPTHAVFDRLKRKSKNPIIPTPSAIPSILPPKERPALRYHPALAQENENPDGDYQRKLPLDRPLLNVVDTSLRRELNDEKLNEASSLIMQHGANPNIQSSNGNTFLHLSAEQENMEYAQHLYALGHRIDPNIRNKKGETVLHILARKPSFKDGINFAILLLWDEHPRQIPVNIFEKHEGETPLEIAARYDNPEMVKKLLECIPIDHESVQKARAKHSGDTTTKQYLADHKYITRCPQPLEKTSSASSSLSSSPTSSAENHPKIEDVSPAAIRPIHGSLPKDFHPIRPRHREKEEEEEKAVATITEKSDLEIAAEHNNYERVKQLLRQTPLGNGSVEKALKNPKVNGLTAAYLQRHEQIREKYLKKTESCSSSSLDEEEYSDGKEPEYRKLSEFDGWKEEKERKEFKPNSPKKPFDSLNAFDTWRKEKGREKK